MMLGKFTALLSSARIQRSKRVGAAVTVTPTAWATGGVAHEGEQLANYADTRESEAGAFTSIGRNTKVTHDTVSAFPYVRRLWFVEEDREREVRDVAMGHDTWIGAHASIMLGIGVDTGTVIALGVVATRAMRPYAIVAGMPARAIGVRFPDDIADLMLRSRWWLAPKEKMRATIHHFQAPVGEEVAQEIVERFAPSASPPASAARD